MGLFTIKTESVKSIEAVADELERCHKLLLADPIGIPAGLDKGTLEHNMHEMQELLMLIAKRHNGMEY